MIKRALLAASAALLSVAVPTPGAASSTATPCIFLVPDVSRETLINRCPACREVSLERTRAGEANPDRRTMIMPGEAAATLPFLGPGRTRIVGEQACPDRRNRGSSQAAISR